MEVILDTNFIISCVRKRIDFLSELADLGFNDIAVPKEVIQEMKDIKKRTNESFEDRAAVNVAFEMLKERKIKEITLGCKLPDEGLIKLGKKGAYIATLDAEIKHAVPNKVVINNSKNGLEVVRD